MPKPKFVGTELNYRETPDEDDQNMQVDEESKE